MPVLDHLGSHEGMWVSYSELRALAKICGETGRLKEIEAPYEIPEGMFVNIEGIWFEIFLYDDPRKRYFIEQRA